MVSTHRPDHLCHGHNGVSSRQNRELCARRVKSGERAPDHQRVKHPQDPDTTGAVALATVIPLTAGHRERLGRSASGDSAEAVVVEPIPEVADDVRAEEVLSRRVGPRWSELPTGVARDAIRAEALLELGPTDVDPAVTGAEEALERAGSLRNAATALVEVISEEAEVLSEALGADVTCLPLEQMHEVAQAVVALSAAPRGVGAWGAPAEAEAAEVVLRVSEPHLREAARSYEVLYAHFTDGIWDISPQLLASAGDRWRLISRARLRTKLRAVSRNRRIPGRLSRIVAEVTEAQASRSQLAVLGPLLSHHLAELDRGPLSDIGAALSSLDAVRRLQRSLGDRLDADRLVRLLQADAFRSHDVVGPATTVRSALHAWASDVPAASGDRAWATDLAQLQRWSDDLAQLLPALHQGVDAAQRSELTTPTLRSLVDALVLRDHVAQLRAGQAHERADAAADRPTETSTTEHAGSAS